MGVQKVPMAPPKFADLSKKFKDLASDDFGMSI
jgi:hypothetical protein